MELIRNDVQSLGAVIRDERREGGRYTLTLRPEADRPVTLTGVRAVFSFAFTQNDALFVNGYQSWTYSPERTVSQSDAALCRIPKAVDKRFGLSQYGDGFFDAPLRRQERPSTLHTQRNTLYRRQLDGRAFRSDPDVFLLRDDHTSLTDEQKHTLAIVNALFGSVLFSSDDFSAYDEKKRRLFAALCQLQQATVLSVETGPLTDRLRTVTVVYALNGAEKSSSSGYEENRKPAAESRLVSCRKNVFDRRPLPHITPARPNSSRSSPDSAT